MEFVNSIKSLSEKINHVKDTINSEEATKTALVLPFIAALGYDVFDPQEVIPEFEADIGIKKGEKVDYAIQVNGTPLIIIECKHWRENLDIHHTQLFRYFQTTRTKVAILTNGIEYRFYSDLSSINILDDIPFLSIDLSKISEDQIVELRKFKKENFNIEIIKGRAKHLRDKSELKKILLSEFKSPSEEFVRVALRKLGFNPVYAKTVQEYLPVFKEALTLAFKELNIKASEMGKGPVEPQKEIFHIDNIQPKQNKYLKMRVIFPDGSQIYSDNVTDTYVDTLKRLGIERIRTLGIIKHGVKLVDVEKHPSYNQRFIEPNYFLFANLSTLDKIKIIRELAGKFDVNLKVEEFYK